MRDYTIILADDHVMMREGIRLILGDVPDFKVIGEAGNGIELLNLLKKKVPDMVILDISMPGLRGIEAAHEIHTLYPDIHVLILSMHKSEEFFSMALAAGARGYLLKEDSADELLNAVKKIRKGETYLSAKLARLIPQNIISICRGNHKPTGDSLTHRERQVLHLISEGKTDREIGELLCISIRTVQRHRANIRNKLKLKRTADLVRYAISQGYGTSD